jgi:hypothetical protein
VVARFDASSVPLLQHVRVDAHTLGLVLLVALLTDLVFGLAPSLRVSATAPHGALKAGKHRVCDGPRRSWTRSALVVGEVALACVLPTGAGLLLRSLVRVLEVDLGFQADHVMAIRVDPAGGVRGGGYLAEFLRQVRAVPGVDAAGLTDSLPLGENYGWRAWPVGANGQVYEPGGRPFAHPRIVDDGYLSVMRIPLLAGRWFTPAGPSAPRQQGTTVPSEDPLLGRH